MNITKKLVYTLVSVIALQAAAVPAHASIWSMITSKYSDIAARVQNMSSESKRTIGFVAAGIAALTAVWFGACMYKKNKKQAAVAKAEVPAVAIAQQQQAAQAEVKVAAHKSIVKGTQAVGTVEPDTAGMGGTDVIHTDQHIPTDPSNQSPTMQTRIAHTTSALATDAVAAISQGASTAASTVASTTAALATSTAKAMGNGALSVVEYATRQEKIELTQMRTRYKTVMDAFNDHCYKPELEAYKKALETRKYQGAVEALERIGTGFKTSHNRLFKDIKTLRDQYKLEQPTIGRSGETIKAGIDEMDGWMKEIVAKGATCEAKNAELYETIQSEISKNKLAKGEPAESKRAS